ncbi:hypothetical protein C5167_043684 [Papaver somniferum]|uniref:Uncharacterized protein n=1 Tax=Papaver somniferum TaxID=3469 RepID=A0A4Y7L917_PAPSO|nr:hypothetical protein C5167_043684 [Papaver somniferum]
MDERHTMLLYWSNNEINAESFTIIRDRSVPGMGGLWLNADYVKRIHMSGEVFSEDILDHLGP